MGCSSSITKEHTGTGNYPHSYTNYLPKYINGRKRMSLEEQKLKYNINHENFENLMLDPEIRNNFFTGNNHGFLQFFEQFYGRYKYKFEAFNMSHHDVKDVILEKLVESQIKDDLLFREWNVTDFISNIFFEQPEISVDQAEVMKNFILNTGRYFPAKQKGCYVVINNLENVQKWGLKPYLECLKFNASFQMHNFNLVLSPFIFQKEENLIEICEVIECNPNLISLTITFLNLNDNLDSEEKYLKDFKPDANHLNWLKHIFNTVRTHPGIKFLSFGNYFSEYMNCFSLGKEETNSLLELFKCDKLIGFNFMKMNLDKKILAQIISSIGHSQSLKFFMMDLMFEIDELKLIRSNVIKNKKLLGVYISCGREAGEGSEIKGIRDEIRNENPHLNFVEIVKEFKL